MTDHKGTANGQRAQVPEAMQTLAAYLQRSLDNTASIVMMRHTASVYTVYLGDPEGLREDLKQVGTIEISLANEMLESTSSGANQILIGG